ncbi:MULTISPECIES: DUF3958 family protein [Listeria]|uniref:DUF3958 family protein n=1 Tax=Listeria TaxID=1637 RepID=UPI000B58E48F|nr:MULTISPECIES: DUF3958 family protein [Listeria]
MSGTSPEELTQQLFRLEEAKYEVEQEQRQLEKIEELFDEHIYQKDSLFNEIQETWRVGEIAYQTNERVLQLKNKQQLIMEDIIQAREEVHSTNQKLEKQIDKLERQRKKAWDGGMVP